MSVEVKWRVHQGLFDEVRMNERVLGVQILLRDLYATSWTGGYSEVCIDEGVLGGTGV